MDGFRRRQDGSAAKLTDEDRHQYALSGMVDAQGMQARGKSPPGALRS